MLGSSRSSMKTLRYFSTWSQTAEMSLCDAIPKAVSFMLRPGIISFSQTCELFFVEELFSGFEKTKNNNCFQNFNE